MTNFGLVQSSAVNNHAHTHTGSFRPAIGGKETGYFTRLPATFQLQEQVSAVLEKLFKFRV